MAASRDPPISSVPAPVPPSAIGVPATSGSKVMALVALAVDIGYEGLV
ncbi:hypothetical protein [Acidiphilium rubrum]|nr:hypothetical protein [Acidiphilium rubrum]